MYIDASQSNTTTRFTWTLLWAVLLLATGVTPAAGQTLDLLAPSDGTEIGYDQPVPLDWVYSDSTAVTYKIEVAARQSDGTCDMTSVTWSRRQYSERTFDFDTLESYGGSSFDIPGGTLAPGTQYCWHVRVRDGVQFVATSSTGTFELLPSPPTSPSLISPADGEMDVPVDVTYRWSTVSGASQYQYQISSDAAFPSSSTTSGVASETGGTEVTAAPHYFSEGTCEDINGRVVCLEDTSTHLDSMTTYHWRVRSINATDTSAWAGRSFTTVPPATAAPTGLTPADGVEWQVPTLSLSWDPLSAADSFRVELAEANRTGDAPNRYSDWRWSTSTTQTQVSPPTLNRLSRYVWRVASINAGGATASAWQVFETAPDPPGAVQLAGPANGAVTGRHARVRWTAVSGARSYEIQCAPIADGAGPGAANWSGSAVISVQHVAPSWGAGAGPGSVLRASVTGLEHDQRYAWRVRGVNPAEVGPWPEARALRTETAPGGRRYYVSDHLRSTRAVVDPAQAADPSSGLSLAAAAAQAVVEARDYYPYGLRMPGRQVQDAQGAPQDYTGHELDETTGFHYAGARYYSSALARWGSVDPLADEFAHASPYNYVEGNPFGRTDPDGKSWITKLVKATVKVGKTVSREGVGALKKGATYADAFAGPVTDAQTVFDSEAGTGERFLAAGSLISELFPVSGRDVADVYRGVKRLVGGADEAGDAARSGVAEIRQHGDRHFSVTTHADESLQTELTFDATTGTASVQKTSGPGDRSVFVEVPDIDAAQSAQQSMIGPAGAYNANSNSCLTHCADVVNAGGGNLPNTTLDVARELQSKQKY